VRHARSCPRGIDKNAKCTCGGLDPVPPGLTVDGPIRHAGGCEFMINADKPCSCGAVLPMPVMTPGPAQGATPPKPTDDNPYRDVEYARSLIQRAEKAFEKGEHTQGDFLLRLATEARLLAELQGKWEY
jgi:hypothetical protein